MSLDLFVMREVPLGWTEVRRACDAVASANDGVSFREIMDDAEDTSAYFWDVDRVSLSIVRPDPDDREEEDPPELAKPFVVVSSRSGAWPWIEWSALTLAQALGARIFDPQNAQIYEASRPEHDLAGLRLLHDEYLREHKPKLVSSSWAFADARDVTPAGLRPLADLIETVAKDVLGIDSNIALKADQINLWHTYTVDGAELVVSTNLNSFDPRRKPQRSFHVEGPAVGGLTAAYVDGLANRLGVRFRSSQEYR